MKKGLLTAFLMVALVGAANAQSGLASNNNANFQGVTNASAQIDVLTTVIERLVVTGDQDLDFGFVTAPATGTANYSQLQNGQFTITGQDGATVSLTQGGATSATLTGGTNGPLTFTPDALAGSTTLGGGSATVDVTGSIDVPAGASGDFSGVYELSVEYTAI